ncbi:MAG: TVP38/TMEM64 family protein [Mariprofundales bacterium]|nr:TVP38/TMEM64 family protein [Mariprofundales bacterium]
MKRALPLLAIAAVIAVAFAFDLQHQLSFANLAAHRAQLLGWVQAAPWIAGGSYLLLYITVVALSLPGGLIMTLSGGFLFGAVIGGSLAITGATIGATILFLIAKTSLGDYLLAKAGDRIKAMQQGFADDAFNYLLMIRLVPLFPFFLVNLAPAFLGVSLRPYVLATAIGITPATFVFALAGSGLGTVFDQGGAFSPTSILTPQMIAALTGMALLALIPIIYRRLHNKEQHPA